jgi:hypothetical protein
MSALSFIVKPPAFSFSPLLSFLCCICEKGKGMKRQNFTQIKEHLVAKQGTPNQGKKSQFVDSQEGKFGFMLGKKEVSQHKERTETRRNIYQ